MHRSMSSVKDMRSVRALCDICIVHPYGGGGEGVSSRERDWACVAKANRQKTTRSCLVISGMVGEERRGEERRGEERRGEERRGELN